MKRNIPKPIKEFLPEYKIVFTSQCHTDNEKLENRASDDLVAEDEISRMKWISDVAQQFHELMGNKKEAMEEELRKIAAWVG